jgi:pyridoxamine 5'-phosphate oxidase-like protein
MANTEPVAELDARFSSEDATAREWSEGRQHLGRAEVYWISTVRPDGRPHVTPLIAVWLDDALCFCTGPDERKASNVARNPYCVVTTGSNALGEGFDVVVEGTAARVNDDDGLRDVAGAYRLKYGDSWRFAVRDGAFHYDTGIAAGDGHGRGPGVRGLSDKSLRLRQGRAVQPDPLAVLAREQTKGGRTWTGR